MVNIFEKSTLGDLAADDRPSLRNELFSIERRDRCRRGERLQKIQQPQRSGCMVMAFDLGKVERQVVRQQTMLHPGLFHGDLGIGQRQLLEIMRVVH